MTSMCFSSNAPKNNVAGPKASTYDQDHIIDA